MSLPYSSHGYFLGIGSPVSAAVSIESWSPSSHSTSAGVSAPPRRWITSPGTSLETPMTSILPSRMQGMVDSILFVSSSSAFLAFSSSRKPRMAFTTSIAAMTAKSGQSSASTEMRQLISSITGMVPTNCFRSIFQSGVSGTGISFGPHCWNRASACAPVRPPRGSSGLPPCKASLARSLACRSLLAMTSGAREAYLPAPGTTHSPATASA
mmetsp:Transcript_95721/g.247480  ORF Transcript_95721/g.247480 Transcript_95721/m.247480 type:complete len:211 (-) Transcript_95721:19-651(-)